MSLRGYVTMFRTPQLLSVGEVQPAPVAAASTFGAPESVHTFGFLMVPDFSMIAFTSAIEPLRLANRCSGKTLYGWRIFSPDGQPVTASNGVSIAVDGAYADVGPMPAVVVCAGVDVHRFDHGALIAKLRTLAFYGVQIGAVCTGTHVLAKAGLLAGRKCTIHWENNDSFREEFSDIDVTQELFEIDRNRFTCAGGTAAIDMMLSMIAKQKGPEIAAQVTDQLIHHRQRDSHERQRMELRARLGVAHPKLLAVVSEMEKSLETPLSCAELADEVGLSTRQLERLFRKYIGEAPTKYYLSLRLNRARFLLRQTSMPILTIGLACGFVSASHFSKCYSEHFGRTPSHERRGLQ
ncbi:AraC family transcriptional regulator [Alsobacter metallidurans]|uniref:AraC family transcriptional regulator n=1 Tax=Alsobacter metallidurans TaxID=340221 RepID=A0A917I9F6_9HYPH|nr:GlxA family transcriptional regulator [Alsobacter metallidurans]GGH29103.1 AraC family transcriptional regulator [Alsobacter metallidurans]